MLDTKESGSLAKTSVKEKVDRSGQMAPCMKAGGKITKPTEKVDLSMLMEMFMTVNGSMIRLMDLESTAILTVPSMKVTGKRISNTEMDSRPGQMVPSTRVNTSKVRKMVRADSLGLMAQHITESSMRTIFKVLVNTTGQTEESTTVSG